MGAYKGKASVFKEADEKTSGFKKGGKAMDKEVMSEAAEGRKARKSGGAVLSSAAAGTPRGKASHY
jgi:hypothetical protein